MDSQERVHVVFGAGQVGPLLASRLRAAGRRVRVVRRGAGEVLVPGVEVVRGDAADASFCAGVARDAAVLYNCMNPAYDRKLWAEQLPRIADALTTAAARSGARVVVLDNVYALGRPGGRMLDETSPVAPCSRKGEIRAAVAARYLEAHRSGTARVVLARASDFYGPGAVGSQFEAHFWGRLLAGKSVQLLMNPDTPHTYHHVQDVAAGLALLGAAPDDAFGQPWMLPCAPAITTRALAEQLAAAAGHPGPRIQRAPRALVKGVALFWPLMRELDEMLYQWEEPFVVDDARFRARFAAEPTALEDGARAMAAWAVEHYGKRGARHLAAGDGGPTRAH